MLILRHSMKPHPYSSTPPPSPPPLQSSRFSPWGGCVILDRVRLIPPPSFKSPVIFGKCLYLSEPQFLYNRFNSAYRIGFEDYF